MLAGTLDGMQLTSQMNKLHLYVSSGLAVIVRMNHNCKINFHALCSPVGSVRLPFMGSFGDSATLSKAVTSMLDLESKII